MGRTVLRIGLVEDDPGMARAFVRLFRLMGMCAEHFRSGEELLASEDAQLHCYVIDVQLPGMSGIELRRQLQAHAPSTPAVLISALDDLDPSMLTQDTFGASAPLLAKPFTGRLLADTVLRVTAHV